jgi:hypothetical protein
MAYTPTYQIAFTNELMQGTYIIFSEKDGEATEVQTFAAVSVKLSYEGDEGKFGCLYSMIMEAELNLQEGETDPREDFINADRNEWKCEVLIDDKPFFSGFVLPDEDGIPFQDLPYNMKVTAVDCIGLLREKTIEENVFTSHHSLINYVAYCLQQTGLELPIRVYDNIYHHSMLDRSDSIEKDFFNQAFLEYRTFLDSATTFVDCYKGLEIILKPHYDLHQWNGHWVITRKAIKQTTHDQPVYYTLYDYTGDNPVGFAETENYATVGKLKLIFPINETQIRYTKKAVKTSKTFYDYEIWPELPKNNKFDRGNYVGTTLAVDDSDLDGDDNFTETLGVANNYTVADWEYGEFNLADYPAFTMNPAAVMQPLTRKVINEHDLEIIREVSIPGSISDTDGVVSGIKSEVIPVVQGDRIKFSVDKRYNSDVSLGASGYSGAAIIYVTPTGGGPTWYLINSFNNPQRNGIWVNDFLTFSFASVISVAFGDTDTRRYTSVSLESHPIPVTGDLRVILYNPSGGGGWLGDLLNLGDVIAYYRGFELEYLPMVAGGFQKVKGDSWEVTQDTNFPDKRDLQVTISDNQHKVFKGCLLDGAGVPFTADWYRFGVDEHLHFKQLTARQFFNLEHRRMDMVEGDFKTLMFAPENSQELYYPIGFHKQYRFMDFGESVDRRCELSPPLEMDLIKCWVNSRYWEIYDADKNDGEVAGTESFKYRF